MDKIKVIIADDSDFVRDGMKIILDVDDDFDVLGAAANGKEAIELAEKEKPDIFLMDIQMPVMDGIEATKYIVEHDLGKVLILTTFDDDELVQQALRNGAKGYLIKNHTPDHLKQMIRSVYNGTGVMEESILETLAGKAESGPAASGSSAVCVAWSFLSRRCRSSERSSGIIRSSLTGSSCYGR